MTLDELATSLPNGLHDAELRVVTLDFIQGEARLELDVWMGEADEMEAYRLARLTLLGLLFWVSEPPDPQYPYALSRPVRIDLGPLTDKHPEKQPALPKLPSGAFANWLFVDDWNAFIFIAAEAATLEWLADRMVRTV